MVRPLPNLRLFLICFVFFISASILVDSQSQDSPLSPPLPPQSLSPPSQQRFSSPPPVKVEGNKAIHEKHHHRRKKWRQRKNHNHHHHRKQKLNTGKTVGLFFIGVVAALQLVVAAFLLFKRRQILLHINHNTH